MALETRERNLGVTVHAMGGNDIARDVRFRRVFLRTGLAERDDLDHMVVAHRVHPGRPGAIILPAWLIGRQWCHAATPDCPACALSTVCPELIARAASVLSF
jgi:endonuclease III